jgi:uncharacterized protein (TIGR03067 family)
MKRHALAILAVSLTLAASARTQDGDKKADQFEGTWSIVSLELNGKKLPEDEIKGGQVTVQGNGYTTKFGGRTFKGTFKTDPTKKPKALDVTPADGPNAGKVALAIYELDGDTLKVCSALPGKDRPTEFASKEGSQHEVIVYRRVKQ